uniref:magnesium transporter n=1 Tax=Rhodococcoides kroppenstedtii TaxID=293050 RepID=UPI0035303F43
MLSDHDLAGLADLLSDLREHEVTRLLERLDADDRAVLFRLIEKDTALGVFESLDPPLRGELVDALRDDHVVALFEDLDPDDRVELLDELPASVARRLLSGLSDGERTLTAPMLGYPRGSVGRRMSPEYVRLRPDTTAAEDAPTVTATTDAEVAARLCLEYRTAAVVVTDSERRVLGVLTVDTAARILEDAEDEDAARAGGSEPLRRPYLSTPVGTLVRSRVVWLLVLAVSAVLTVQVLEIFEDTLSAVVTLALFIPLLTGTGGNTGSQAATTVTRALAVGDVRTRDLGRVLFREVRVGASMGALLGTLGFVVAGLVYDWHLGLVIGATLLTVCTIAAAVGGVMPLCAKAIGVDPAVFSTPAGCMYRAPAECKVSVKNPERTAEHDRDHT